TLEFENHRPLYDWFIDAVNEGRPRDKQIWHPQQIEFARLNLTYTMLSKRKLLQLVTEKIVSGWDDPRMPTISGFRRRGYTPESIRAFCKHIGVNKFNSTVDVGVLENFLREDLNKRAARKMAVLRPLKVVITNYPEGQTEEMDAVNNPEDPSAGTRSTRRCGCTSTCSRPRTPRTCRRGWTGKPTSTPTASRWCRGRRSSRAFATRGPARSTSSSGSATSRSTRIRRRASRCSTG